MLGKRRERGRSGEGEVKRGGGQERGREGEEEGREGEEEGREGKRRRVRRGEGSEELKREH